MKRLISLAFAVTSCMVLPAHAHRLDEYLQATLLSVDHDHLSGTLRLVPGVAVAPQVLENIDIDGDGVLSAEEQRRYSRRILNDLDVEVDEGHVQLQLMSFSFPTPTEIRGGTGEIEVGFSALLPRSTGSHTIRFSNRHLPRISVYLVNTLVPADPDTHLGEQSRDASQSTYQITYQSGSGLTQPVARDLSGFTGAFRLGLRHIAEGTDHLLFLLTLLLPAPLVARGGRWIERASIKKSLIRIAQIVTAFTVGHSVTLLLSALDVLALPGHPVEVLIAVSILVSAIHAMRPIFPGRESLVAAFFGLIHGAAFASALTDFGFSQWYKLVSILAFNLGIETMQLVVVLATLPSLLLLSRTAVYPLFRWTGALIAAVASLGWVAERAWDRPNQIGIIVEQLAGLAPWLALGLFVVSAGCWSAKGLRFSAKTARLDPAN